MTAEKLLQEALALPEDARVDLAEALLESVESGPAVKPVPWEEAERLFGGSVAYGHA